MKKRNVIVVCLIAVIILLWGAAAFNKNRNLTLADGSYTPSDFTWSGGSGRVEISCEEIRVEEGRTYGVISFNSAYYSVVRIDNTSYEGTHTQDTSTFVIPVELNEENTIFATTTKMSSAHEVTYSIYPYLDASKKHEADESETSIETGGTNVFSHTPPVFTGLEYERSMELTYAQGFDVFYYSDGYIVINVYDSRQYLIIPEGAPNIENVPDGMVVLHKPVNNIYLAASSAMALFRGINALDCIRFTGIDAPGWYVEEAALAIHNGSMAFAGKYSEPDYELLVDGQCELAIESTMILHAPKVQEMLESLGIPVFIDRSSYESHPLGRTEWIKLYGVLTDKEEQAKDFFDEQAQIINELKDFPNTEKTVAYFYIDTDGTVVVRSAQDYIPKMIEIAGGRYAFDDLSDKGNENTGTSTASVSLTMEEFYATARDSDYLIYNGTIDNPLTSVDDLLDKSELFADFKAVKEKNVWTIGKDLYQSTDIVGQLIEDVHLMLTGEDNDSMTFLVKVE